MKTIPKNGETSEQLDSIVHIKLFDSAGSWTWYVIEYDPDDRICYGWVCGFEQEFGSFSLAEMESIRGPLESFSVTCTYGASMLDERPTGAGHRNRAEARIGCGPAALGLRVERDLFFTPCLLSELPRPHRPDIFEE